MRNKMSNSTFPIAILNRKDNYSSEEKKVAIVGREALHNAHAQNAKNVLMLNLEKDAKQYIGIAHDGNPFSSLYEMQECMKPSVTGGDGVQGNGMKASMFLLTQTSNDAEFLIHNRSDSEKTTARLTCENFNDALIEVSNDWNDYLEEVLGEIYHNYNVIYIYRYQANGKEGLIKTSNVRLMAEICPSIFSDMKIRSRHNTIYGLHYLVNTSHLSEGRFLNNPDIVKVNEDFCNDKEIFNIDFSVEINGIQYEFNADIDILVYPNIVHNLDKRPLILNGEDAGQCRSEGQHSQQSLFVKCNFDIENCNKNLTRATSDPYYTSNQNFDYLAKLGIYCRKNQNFDSKLQKYWGDFFDRLGKPLYKEDGGLAYSWSPIIKINISLNPKNKNSIFPFGGLNEFFLADDDSKVRKIVAEAFDALAVKNPKNLVDFRDRMKNHFPYDQTNDLAPIPKEKDGLKNELLIDVVSLEEINSNGKIKEKIIRDIDPGQHKSLVELRYKNGKPFLEKMFNISEGVIFNHISENKYSLSVERLMKINSDGTKSLISPEEYKHTKDFSPKNRTYCDTASGNKYRFTFDINIPTREITVSSGGRRIAMSVNNDYLDIDEEIYQSFEESLIGIYNNGKLILNKNNSVIIQMATFDMHQHSALYNRWLAIYENAKKIARKAHIKHQESLEIDFRRVQKDHLEKKYGTAEKFFVNSHLEIFFESAEALSLLNDVSCIRRKAA